MPNTKLTKARFSNHMHYSKYIYLVVGLVVWFMVDITFTMTEYRPPKERKVEIQLVSAYSTTEGLIPVAEQALSDGQAFDETLEAVEFFSLMYSGEEDDMYGAQKYMVMLAAQEGHIYIVNRGLMEQLVYQGGALPLDSYIESGALNTEGMDLSDVTVAENKVVEESTSDEKHVYALPADSLGGFLASDISFDPRDMYIVVMAYVPNPDTTVAVLRSIMDQMEAPLPDWAIEQAQQAEDNAVPEGDYPWTTS